jgi:tetratricopeptide (TPR) repeat protein
MNEFAENHCQKAVHLTEIKRWQEAIREANLCLAIDPSHYSALCLIANCLLELGEIDKALQFTQKAISSDPHQEWAYRLQSVVYYEKNDKKKQFETALSAANKDPESVAALQSLAFAQFHLNKLKDSRNTVEKIRRLAPDSAQVHTICGIVEIFSRNPDEAEKYFRHALKLEPANYEALNALGEFLLGKYIGSGNFEERKKLLNEATDCFRQAVIINPQMPAAKNNLTRAKTLSGSSGIFILAPFLALFSVLIVGTLNTKGYQSFRPEFLNIEDKPVELQILFCLTGIGILITSFMMAVIGGEANLSENNKTVIEINEGVDYKEKLTAILWLSLSAYPLILIVWKTFTDTAIFKTFQVFDWFTISVGIAAMLYNFFVIKPYLFKRPKN